MDVEILKPQVYITSSSFDYNRNVELNFVNMPTSYVPIWGQQEL